MNTLDTITALSHEFGTPDYVKGGGGNTSCKTEDILWVKPSGTTLAGLKPGSFVQMSRVRLAELYGMTVPPDADSREAMVKSAMAAAVLDGQTGRPSVEAPLHDVLTATYVVHTHPARVNGMTCATCGAGAAARLFPEALWVPYIDPGYTLCMDVRNRVLDYTSRFGRQPSILLLENHGIFVAANTDTEVRELYGRVMAALEAEYHKAGIDIRIAEEPAVPAALVESTRRALVAALAPEAPCIVHGGAFEPAPGPISPDHIVYAKAFPHTGPVTADSVARFRQRHGYTPMIFSTEAGVFAAAPTAARAQLTLDLARDGALVRRLAAAFGGIQYMSDRARSFIENWEVESYRQKQM